MKFLIVSLFFWFRIPIKPEQSALESEVNRLKRCLMCRIMDELLDPVPKEFKSPGSDAGKVLYYQSQNESYRRHKHLQYRNLLLSALICFFLGLVTQMFFKFF